ncbi:MAG: PIN domain-containing protein [Methanospirillaceae archaeon]|nr:PIN domain-containing protein [Methanospirillaceae archaeon]
MKVYLDVCCLCRPFDDQSVYRIRQETDAIKEILSRCDNGWELAISEMTIEEISQIPDPIRRDRVQPFLSLASTKIKIDESIINRMYEIRSMGIKTADAFHIACAEQVHATLITTDDRLVQVYNQDTTQFVIRIQNPVHLLEEDY